MSRVHLVVRAILTGLAACALLACDDTDEPTGTSSSSTAAGGSGTTSGSGGASPDSLSAEELERVVAKLAADDLDGRDEGSPGGVKARGIIIEELEKCGVQPAGDAGFEQPITTGNGVNVLGRIAGRDTALAERFVLLSAHYDHIGGCPGVCNGANDNAAAVSIVVGVACALAKEPPSRSVLIAAWDAEEPPTFLTAEMGSEYYAAHPVVPLSVTDTAIALDLVGADWWPGFEGHMVLGAELSAGVAAALDATPIPDGLPAFRGGLHLAEDTPLGHQPWSDYDAFRNRDIPVLFLSNGQNKTYHETTDELAGLNLPKMSLEAKYLFAIVSSLANAEQSPSFDAEGTAYDVDAATVKAVLDAALADGGLVDALGLSATSRSKLVSDRERIVAIQALIDAGTPLSETDISALRAGAQRVMCLAGSQYSEATCSMF